MNDSQASFNERPRTLADRLTLAVAVIFLLRLFVVEAYRIPSNSMALTLRGPCYQGECPHCHIPVTLSELPAKSTHLQCPNCQGAIETTRFERTAGDRAIVLKNAGPPYRRFDVVAFYPPDHPRTPFVKRILGLPGETIRIEDGDLWRWDSEQGFVICPKPLDLVLAMARTIYDDRFHSPSSNPARWISPDQAFTPTPEGYRLTQKNGSLAYHHLGTVAPIEDDEPFLPQDSGSPRPQGERIHDLLLDLVWHPSDSTAELSVTLHHPKGNGVLSIRTTGLDVVGTHLPPNTVRAEISPGTRVRWGRADRRWAVWMDDRLVAQWAESSIILNPTDLGKTTSAGATIRAKGDGSTVTGLVLRRDVHYRAYAWAAVPKQLADPLREGPTPTWRLGEEYFVAGDNTARSRDSRHWPDGPGVAERQILGKVVARLATGSEWGWSRVLGSMTGDERANGSLVPSKVSP